MMLVPLRAMWVLWRAVGIPRVAHYLVERVEQAEFYVPALALSVVVADVVSWRFLAVWEHLRWTQAPSPDLLLHYLPFFLFGIAAERRPGVWSRFGNTACWYARANIGMLVALLLSFSSVPTVAAYSLMFLDSLAGWTLVALVIRVARKYLDRPAPAVISSPDIAYSVYLVHHLVIAGLAVVFVGLHTSTSVQFVLLMLLASGISIALARLISRVSILRFAFNGRTAVV